MDGRHLDRGRRVSSHATKSSLGLGSARDGPEPQCRLRSPGVVALARTTMPFVAEASRIGRVCDHVNSGLVNRIGRGGSAVPVLYLHHGFLSFLADRALRVLEIIREFEDCGGPTPAASKIFPSGYLVGRVLVIPPASVGASDHLRSSNSPSAWASIADS